MDARNSNNALAAWKIKVQKLTDKIKNTYKGYVQHLEQEKIKYLDKIVLEECHARIRHAQSGIKSGVEAEVAKGLTEKAEWEQKLNAVNARIKDRSPEDIYVFIEKKYIDIFDHQLTPDQSNEKSFNNTFKDQFSSPAFTEIEDKQSKLNLLQVHLFDHHEDFQAFDTELKKLEPTLGKRRGHAETGAAARFWQAIDAFRQFFGIAFGVTGASFAKNEHGYFKQLEKVQKAKPQPQEQEIEMKSIQAPRPGTVQNV